MNISSRTKLALAIAQEAGSLLLAEADKIKKMKKGRQHISHKTNIRNGSKEIVTSVDRLVDNFIIKSLQTAFPQDFILTEESYKKFKTKRRMRRRTVWLIDPIDGTKEFTNYLLNKKLKPIDTTFSISIALVIDKLPVMGVIFVPLRNELIYASRGSGAFIEINGKPPQRLRVKNDAHFKNLDIAVTGDNLPLGNYFGRILGAAKITAIGPIAHRFIQVANNHDVVITTRESGKEWDVAAADIIIRESGGVLLQADGSHFQYNKEDIRNKQIYFSSNKERAIEIIHRLRKNNIAQPKIAFIGCISHSTPMYPDGIRERFGGGVIYGSETAKKLGLDVTVITAGAKDIDDGISQLTKQGIKAIRLTRKTSNNFSNDYSGPKRILRMSSVMPGSVTKKEIQKYLPKAHAWILNPIFHEVSPALIPTKRDFIVFMDVQGLTRKVKKHKDGYYHLVDHKWTGWKQWKSKIDILRVSDEDIEHMAFPVKAKTLTQKIIHLTHQGFPLVVVTQGSKPTIVATKKSLKTIPVIKVSTVDTGGAGDSFNAGFVAGYLSHRDPVVAAAYGNATAGFMVGGKGTENVPDLATVTKKAHSILKSITYAI